MDHALQSIIESQHGIFARRQAIAAGIPPKVFDKIVGRPSSPWVRIRYGVYAERSHWMGLEAADRTRLVDRAALLVCDDGTILSHTSAARQWQLPLYRADDDHVHVTRTHDHERQLSRIVSGVHHHCARIAEWEVAVRDGLRLTSPGRTALDIGAQFGYLSGLVVADAALRRGVSRNELTQHLAMRDSDPRFPLLSRIVASADAGAETPIETLGREALIAVGIDDVVTQHKIILPGGAVAFTDLYSDRLHHVFECDGRIKYRNQVDFKGRPLSSDDVLWLEKRREDAIRSLGLGFSRLIWPDIQPEYYARLGDRVWREIRQQDAAGRRTRNSA